MSHSLPRGGRIRHSVPLVVMLHSQPHPVYPDFAWQKSLAISSIGRTAPFNSRWFMFELENSEVERGNGGHTGGESELVTRRQSDGLVIDSSCTFKWKRCGEMYELLKLLQSWLWWGRRKFTENGLETSADLQGRALKGENVNGAHTHSLTLMSKMENLMSMTHLSSPQIPQMKSYLDAIATAVFPRLDQTATQLQPVSQVISRTTSLHW